MKYLLILWFALGCQTALAVQGRLQNDDFKTPAQLTGAGLPLSKLLNDTNIYVTGGGINDQLSTAITSGKIGGGAGSGSEINLLSLNGGNWNAEKTPIGLTNSGGTLSFETAAPLDGSASFKFVTTTNTNFVESPLVTVPYAFSGRKCQVHFPYYKSTSSLGGIQQDFTIYVFDASNNTIATLPLNGTSSAGETTSAFLAFDCPTPISTRLKYRLMRTSATGTATITWDDAFLGQGRNSINTFGAIVTDWVPYTATVSGFGTISAGTFQSRRVGGDLEVRGTFTAGTVTASAAQITLGYNGTNANVTIDSTKVTTTQVAGYPIIFSQPAGPVAVPLITGGTNYFSIGLQTTALVGLTPQPGNNVTANNQVVSFFGKAPIQGWTAERASVEGNTYDIVGWRVDAVQGGANPGLTLVSQSTPVAAQAAGLTITASSGSNVIPVQQPCSTGVPTSTSTCASGNPEVGLVYQQPTQNDVLICAQFGAEFSAANTASRGFGTFQIAETAQFPATTIIQSSKASTSWEYLQNTNQIMGGTYRICNTMTLSAGQHALRLLHTASITGSISTHIILADGLMNRNIHWTVIPLNQNFTAPVFAEISKKVTSPVANEKVYRAHIEQCGVGGTVQSQSGSWITAITNNSAGSCDLTIAAGVASVMSSTGTSLPCVVSAYGGGVDSARIDNSSTPTSLKIRTWVSNTGTPNTDNINIVCVGQ